MNSEKETKRRNGSKVNMLTDKRGVSPVVGVLLLLAITVVMAGYLASEVMSFEFKAPPQPVSLNARAEKVTVGGAEYSVIRLEHAGGAPLQVSDIRILINQTEADFSHFQKESFAIGESIALCGIENNRMAVLSYPVSSSTKKPSRNIIERGEAKEVIIIDLTHNQIIFKKTIRGGN
ncbi:MAG: type IV pilin N-terminal domain-containing protein [Methanimicrococcus sp.]|nr:type IV pilin N-terminal domain-containing protein [Methanimicrococcus sp.]